MIYLLEKADLLIVAPQRFNLGPEVWIATESREALEGGPQSLRQPRWLEKIRGAPSPTIQRLDVIQSAIVRAQNAKVFVGRRWDLMLACRQP